MIMSKSRFFAPVFLVAFFAPVKVSIALDVFERAERNGFEVTETIAVLAEILAGGPRKRDRGPENDRGSSATVLVISAAGGPYSKDGFLEGPLPRADGGPPEGTDPEYPSKTGQEPRTELLVDISLAKEQWDVDSLKDDPFSFGTALGLRWFPGKTMFAGLRSAALLLPRERQFSETSQRWEVIGGEPFLIEEETQGTVRKWKAGVALSALGGARLDLISGLAADLAVYVGLIAFQGDSGLLAGCSLALVVPAGEVEFRAEIGYSVFHLAEPGRSVCAGIALGYGF
jgi:hypothetical protein